MEDYTDFYMDINYLSTDGIEGTLEGMKRALINKNKYKYVSIDEIQKAFDLKYSSAKRLIDAIAALYVNSEFPAVSLNDDAREDYLKEEAKKKNQKALIDIPETRNPKTKMLMRGLRADIFEHLLEFKKQYEDEPRFNLKNKILKSDNLERALSATLWEPIPDIDVNSKQFNEYKNYLKSRISERINRDSVTWAGFQLFKEQMVREKELRREIEELKNSIVVRKNTNLPSEYAFKLGNKNNTNSNNEFIIGENEKNYQEFMVWLKTHPKGPGKKQLNPF